jgi:hypothetical protein
MTRLMLRGRSLNSNLVQSRSALQEKMIRTIIRRNYIEVDTDRRPASPKPIKLIGMIILILSVDLGVVPARVAGVGDNCRLFL